jgi:hypothetical protein
MDDMISKALSVSQQATSAKNSQSSSPVSSLIQKTENPKRVLFPAQGGAGVKGIVVPRHMWEGYKLASGEQAPGMKDINAARAKVYGSENRDPLTLGKMASIHKQVLEEHFKKPVKQQMADENAALSKLQAAKHISPAADTLDASEKTDTVKYEPDPYVPWTSKGVAGHAVYTSGHGSNEKTHILNTCPGQTTGCGGGVDKDGIIDTSRGTCFAPNAESQYGGASIRRACHEQAKHDPKMTSDWILAHAGSLRGAANRADKKGLKTMFRPNVVDETDVSSRHVINGLNKQRAAENKPPIIANSYGKTNELHDPENGYYVTHSNVGPKTKLGSSIAENIGRDKQRVRSTVMAADARGNDFTNDNGNKTPPKNSYLVTDVKRYSDLDKKMQGSFKYAKYWSAGKGKNELSDAEAKEGPEGHFDGRGKPTTPEKAHYGHTTIGDLRYDYQKQHILHPRMVDVGENKDGSPKRIPTDSRFKDDDFLPPTKDRFKTKNGKVAGAILMTTPTESTSNIGHQTSFTHHVSDKHVEYAKKNKGEYEIDPPKEQEKSRGKEYVTPQPIAFNLRPGAAKKSAFAHGGSVGEFDHETMALPEQNYRAQAHNAHRHHEEDGAHQHKHSRLQSNQVVDRAMNLVSNLPRR